MEDEAELVHRCHRGSHRPSRPGTLPRQAHGRNDRRGEEQPRSEEHTSELQSRLHLVCRLLLEKKNQHSIVTRRLNSCSTASTLLRTCLASVAAGGRSTCPSPAASKPPCQTPRHAQARVSIPM